jgi:methyl-accepting chemotaxis protein
VARVAALRTLLDSIRDDLQIVAANTGTDKALNGFKFGFRLFARKGNPTETLQKLYIEDNPNPPGSKQLLDKAEDDSGYTKYHLENHPWFRKLAEDRGYADVMLIDNEGNIVYSVLKDQDFATNLVEGPWKDTELAGTVATLAENPEPGRVVMTDFHPYEPRGGAPTACCAAPPGFPARKPYCRPKQRLRLRIVPSLARKVPSRVRTISGPRYIPCTSRSSSRGSSGRCSAR